MVKSMLVTSEMMAGGYQPLLFTGGACNIRAEKGVLRNPGRDELAQWLDEKGWSYFDPQIYPETHGREYIPGVDGPQEKKARQEARIRIYELTPKVISAVTALEVMDDARLGRTSIVWFHGERTFAPLGLGDCGSLLENTSLREKFGEPAFGHALAYVQAGLQLRDELSLMLHDCPYILFVDGFDKLTKSIEAFMECP